MAKGVRHFLLFGDPGSGKVTRPAAAAGGGGIVVHHLWTPKALIPLSLVFLPDFATAFQKNPYPAYCPVAITIIASGPCPSLLPAQTNIYDSRLWVAQKNLSGVISTFGAVIKACRKSGQPCSYLDPNYPAGSQKAATSLSGCYTFFYSLPELAQSKQFYNCAAPASAFHAVLKWEFTGRGRA